MRLDLIGSEELTEEEMQILRQKLADEDIFPQSLALSLLGEQDGFYRALDIFLKSCKGLGIDSVLAQETLENAISKLRRGNVSHWQWFCGLVEKRPESPVTKIVLKMSPLKRRAAA